MALDVYHQKRDFDRTPEPKGRQGKRAAGNSFVVQKHDARRLHYDFRLEMDGVLKSWAVTRGPSLVPAEKRLAVHVEDHPLDYGDFEGTIPKGEYGGGTVIVWDRGTWKPLGDAKKGLAKGHLEFELDGEKLDGRWHLIRMARRPREKRDNWLLVKGDDAHAREAGDPDILEERPDSVKTGRGIAEVEKEEPGWSSKTGRIVKAKAAEPKIKGAKKVAMPDFVPPQLATLKPHAPDGTGWVHEIKFDGYRLQARLDNGKAALLTRGGLDWTQRFGKVVPKALAALPASQALIDGELVVEASGGASDFSALQADLSAGRSDRFAFYAFDLLYLDGQDLRETPLVARKATLARLLKDAPPELRYSEHFEENGEMVLRHACRLSLEGVVSKRAGGKYRSGRGRDWIKSKCGNRQELVIGGYVPSSTSAKAIGSLVLGVNEDGELRHAGRVGTGFSRVVAEDLFKRLSGIERDTSPFAGRLDAVARRGVRFVEPELVAEVEFRDWTADGILRHAAFRGLREDKPAAEVVREDEAASAAKVPARAKPTVALTHPDRVYWKDAGVTKEGLASYYAQVWRFMAPHVERRPLALLRCPGGTAAKCFFQKHAWKGISREILTAVDPLDEEGDNSLLAVDSLDGLIGLVQGAALEIHGWQARLDDLEKPDQLVIDLDPGDGVPWSVMLDAAREVRARLEAVKLAAFVKTTGGKGLHVAAPLKPKADWDTVKGFARDLAIAMSADAPKRFIAKATKAERKGRIFIDYLRNGRGATAIVPYSTRARAGATVAMPLGWDELEPSVGSGHFTVANAAARLDNLAADPWADFRKAARPLEAAKGGGKAK
ncbi:MAG: DNA ligase D [Aquamicrobium sp.]|uniref:DNA ligase D n=1 Tax=Aquamicrobium sp. TaxID=1872579 RepID=UPI00349ED16E|nr:DNA ligase D [Aquamicrobium sp.]